MATFIPLYLDIHLLLLDQVTPRQDDPYDLWTVASMFNATNEINAFNVVWSFGKVRY